MTEMHLEIVLKFGKNTFLGFTHQNRWVAMFSVKLLNVKV